MTRLTSLSSSAIFFPHCLFFIFKPLYRVPLVSIAHWKHGASVQRRQSFRLQQSSFNLHNNAMFSYTMLPLSCNLSAGRSNLSMHKTRVVEYKLSSSIAAQKVYAVLSYAAYSWIPYDPMQRYRRFLPSWQKVGKSQDFSLHTLVCLFFLQTVYYLQSKQSVFFEHRSDILRYLYI